MRLPTQTVTLGGNAYRVTVEIEPDPSVPPVVVPPVESPPSSNGYTARAGKLYDVAGKEVQLRGVSHQGFAAYDVLRPQYLWQVGWKQQLAQIKSLGFNAIRIPFAPDTLYDQRKMGDPGFSYNMPLNDGLRGMTPLQVLDMFMIECDRLGLYMLPDFHSVTAKTLYQLWYLDKPSEFPLVYNNRAYTKANWISDLVMVAKRYKTLPYFLGLDIYNEPYGKARWDKGDLNAPNPDNFWRPAAEEAAAAVLDENPNLLIFVQGCGPNFDGKEDTSIPMNYGEDFQPQAYNPLRIPDDKLVLSPHTYGPDVWPKSTFAAGNYPANLAAHWEKLFGQFHPKHPVIIGEWGGRYGQGGVGQADVAWQNALVDYLIGKGIRSSFYWCYTPNSGDTGGILDDQLNVREDKMALLRRHWVA